MQNFAYIQQRAQQFRFIANITTRSLWIKYELPIEKHTCHSAWFVRRALSRFSLALSLSAFLLFCHARCRLNTPIDIVCWACFFLLNSLFFSISCCASLSVYIFCLLHHSHCYWFWFLFRLLHLISDLRLYWESISRMRVCVCVY